MATPDPHSPQSPYRLVSAGVATVARGEEFVEISNGERFLSRRSVLFMLASFGLGAGSGYFYRDLTREVAAEPSPIAQIAAAETPPAPTPEPVSEAQPLLPASYTVPAQFGQIGPQLLAAGAIDYEILAAAYERSNQPFTALQKDILEEGSDASILFDQETAYFLLNFFWALGLVNRNTILLDGPLPQYAGEEIDRFASTGGWTAGTKPVAELYASASIVELTDEQQARVEEVAAAVYRPCCDNPTLFPDCNHGMAMLGLLELAASQNAGVDDLFTVAKYANAFWFPGQMSEVASFVQHTQDVEFGNADARSVVSRDVFSSSGFRRVHQWLADNGQLEQAPNNGGGCSL